MPHPVSHSRRRLLNHLALGAAALPLLRLSPAQAYDLQHLSPDDPAAKALHYVADAATIDAKSEPQFTAGSHCGNCALYHFAQARGDWASCDAFTTKFVNSKGWCLSYNTG